MTSAPPNAISVTARAFRSTRDSTVWRRRCVERFAWSPTGWVPTKTGCTPLWEPTLWATRLHADAGITVAHRVRSHNNKIRRNRLHYNAAMTDTPFDTLKPLAGHALEIGRAHV